MITIIGHNFLLIITSWNNNLYFRLLKAGELQRSKTATELMSLLVSHGGEEVQVTGTLLNKTVSTEDDKWGIRWNMIPASLQCYALGDIKFDFIVYNVLAGVLLRDVFPDPDILCRYLDCTQLGAVNWFLEFLMLSLEGIEYHQGAEEGAQTKEEMIQSLRFRDERDKLCEISPPYIRLWTELLGSWPAIPSGGCRFLLQCRQWLPVQMRALAKARIQWSDGRVIRLPQESDLQYARFGLTPEQIGDQTWTEPVAGRLRMMRPLGVRVELLDFKIATVKSFELGRACAVSERIQRWSILEWVLLKPEVLKMFLSRMVSQEGFREFYMNLYDMLRLIHRRIFDEKAPETWRRRGRHWKLIKLGSWPGKVGLVGWKV